MTQSTTEPAVPSRPCFAVGNEGPVSSWSTNKLTATLRCFNLLNGIGLILSGSLCLLTGFVSLGFSSVTVSIYIAFFGVILCCAELKISNLQHKLIRNCGFMFTFLGRALFIIFAGTMCFGLNIWVGWLVGSVTIANGLFNAFVLKMHPAFKSGELSATSNPYEAYSSAENQAAAYIKQNPDLARRAGAGMMSVAAQNPNAFL